MIKAMDLSVKQRWLSNNWERSYD